MNIYIYIYAVFAAVGHTGARTCAKAGLTSVHRGLKRIHMHTKDREKQF